MPTTNLSQKQKEEVRNNLAEILFNLIENKMIESFKKRSDNILN